MNNTPSVLFVCLGNICRSPLAEAVLRHLADEAGIELRVDSAGTGSWHIGEPPCDHSVRVAHRHGLDIRDARARQVEREDRDRFDLVIGLDAKNVADLETMGFANVGKLGRYGFGGEDVPDPYFFPGYEGFEKVYSMIETCCRNLLSELKSSTY